MSWERCRSLCEACAHGTPLFGGVEFRCEERRHDTLPRGECELFELARWARRGNPDETGAA